METLLFVVIGVSVAVWLGQSAFVAAYVTTFFRARSNFAGVVRWPKYAIGLPLRGADPCLAEALGSLLNQDYPEFEIRIIVDGETAPARRVVEAVVKSRGARNVTIEPLRAPSATCSRYAAALAQYLNSLDDSVELVAFADADMIVPPDWLRHMAAALADPRVGGTLGNRWYLPESARWGSLVRYLFNVGAVVPMWLFEIPWTGALSLRLADMRRAGLADKLKRGMTEDAPVKSALAELGLRLKFVPFLTIPNREEIALPNCYQFIERQILWTRLYHPNWIFVVGYAVLSTTAMFGPIPAAIYFAAVGRTALVGTTLGYAVGYVAAMLLLLTLVAAANRRILRAAGERLPAPTLDRACRLAAAMPIAQAFFLLSTLRSQFLRRIRWRGVLYEIRGPWEIRVVEDRPVADAKSDGERMSL